MDQRTHTSGNGYHTEMLFRNPASRRTLLASLACASVASAAHAQGVSSINNQIGIYAMPVFTRASNSTPDPGLYAFLGANQTSRLFSGVGFGAYDQFFHGSVIDAGLDLRASIQKGANAHLNTFLIGGQASFHPVSLALRPYVEVLGGVGGTRAATNPIYKSKAEYGAFAGVDYSVGKRVDLRIIEVGYTSLTTISTAAVTAAASQPSPSRLLNFSAGIVFRLPQRRIP